MASGIIKNTKLNNLKKFEEVFSGQEFEVIDFLKRIFVFNPVKRMTIEEALNHKYLLEFKEEEDEISYDNAEKISFDYNHKFQLEVALFKEREMMNLMDD